MRDRKGLTQTLGKPEKAMAAMRDAAQGANGKMPSSFTWERAPFIRCPACQQHALGFLSAGGDLLTRRCTNCRYSHSEPLPELDKKVLYLDQNAFSLLFSVRVDLGEANSPSPLMPAWFADGRVNPGWAYDPNWQNQGFESVDDKRLV